jgi:hypothetical protein
MGEGEKRERRAGTRDLLLLFNKWERAREERTKSRYERPLADVLCLMTQVQ